MGHNREILIRVDKFEEENSTMINQTKPNAIQIILNLQPLLIRIFWHSHLVTIYDILLC